AALGRPLTDRRSASSVSFSAGHHAPDSHLEPASLVGATRVVYMPGRNWGAIAGQLRHEGLAEDLPCVIVSRAAQPDQAIVRTTLAQLERMASLPAPSILLAGEALREASANDLASMADPVAAHLPYPAQGAEAD